MSPEIQLLRSGEVQLPIPSEGIGKLTYPGLESGDICVYSSTAQRTGNEFRLDWMLTQHRAGKVAVGLNGYYYAQVTDDKGSFSEAIPVGPKRSAAVAEGWSLRRPEHQK